MRIFASGRQIPGAGDYPQLFGDMTSNNDDQCRPEALGLCLTSFGLC
jgi:hypothetical protein